MRCSETPQYHNNLTGPALLVDITFAPDTLRLGDLGHRFLNGVIRQMFVSNTVCGRIYRNIGV